MKFICDCGTHILIANYQKANARWPENLWLGIYDAKFPSEKIHKSKLLGDVWLFDGKNQGLAKFKGLFK